MIHTIVAPIIVFAVIVLVHEFGHFIMAKLTGMKVEEFAIGFWSQNLFCQIRGDIIFTPDSPARRIQSHYGNG